MGALAEHGEQAVVVDSKLHARTGVPAGGGPIRLERLDRGLNTLFSQVIYKSLASHAAQAGTQHVRLPLALIVEGDMAKIGAAYAQWSRHRPRMVDAVG